MKIDELIDIVHAYKAKHSTNSYENFVCLEVCRFLRENKESAFDRNNPNGHITAGGVVVCDNFVLLNHHKKLNKWLGFGGHAESGEINPFITACREVKEECGISGLKSNGVILDIDRFVFKHDEMPNHTHYDFRYLFVANNKNAIKSSESNELVWLPLDIAIGHVNDFALKKLLNKYKNLYKAKRKTTPLEEIVK